MTHYYSRHTMTHDTLLLMTHHDSRHSMTHDICDVEPESADVGRPVCVHSHTTMCRPWCKCLQLTTTQLQRGEAGTDDAGVPVAPTIQYTARYVGQTATPITQEYINRNVVQLSSWSHNQSIDCILEYIRMSLSATTVKHGKEI